MASLSASKSPHDALQTATSELIKASHSNDNESKVGKIIELLAITKELKNNDGTSENIKISMDLLKCLRLMLVDNDKSIRVQSCRAMRYITCSVQILNKMISLNIPIFMMICLEREDNKYLWERMQSLKWIRHLMDNYPKFIPKCCIMSLIGIAQNGKDEFRRICLDSLRELCITNTLIIKKCNGFKVLIDSILNPQLNDISNSLVLTILYILDHPNTRKYLRPSLDIQRLLAPFVNVNPYKTDSLNKEEIEERDKRRNIAQKTLMTMLKSITGIFYLGGDQNETKSCLKVLVDLMRLPNNISGIQWARRTIFNVLENALLPLSNSHKLDGQRGPNLIVNYVCLILMAFIKNGLIECLVEVGMRSDLDLAPRARTLLQRIQFLSAKYLPPKLCSRITNIQKVMNNATKFNDNSWLLLGRKGKRKINSSNECHCDCECHLAQKSKKQRSKKNKLHNLDITVQRNFANMMISELTEGASFDIENEEQLYNQQNLMDASRALNGDDILISSQIICHRLGPQFDLNSTFIRYRYMMDRDIPSLMFQDRIPYHHHRQNNLEKDILTNQFTLKSQKRHILESLKFDQNASYTENVILSMLKQTKVILTKDFLLWNMNSVWKCLNGPLWSLTNLHIAFKTKFIKRLLQYLKPSKQFFCSLKWNNSTIRHAQCACQLFRLLISTDDGCKNQHFQELIAELFDHLKDQIESNLQGTKPQLAHCPFARHSIRFTLSRVYLILIGILSESERGIKFFAQYHMLAFLFPLTRKEITDHRLSKDRIIGPNDYLLRLIATNLDYAVSDDFRMLYPQWMSSGSYYLRKCLITHLELLYRGQMPKFDEWSINVLAVILKDKEQRLALTALKVLEKINLSQHSIKSTQYLIDLIHTQPTDSIVGIYGQFLFIKMLSTKQGFSFLQSSNWLTDKRKQWSSHFHLRYTNMLETALVHSVSTTTTANNIQKDHEKKDKNEEENEWLPYHLIHENRSDEDELYHEYLTQFPWNLKITLIGANGQETKVANDCFFDLNCFYYKDAKNKNPISLGPGIHAIILNENGCSKPLKIEKNARLKISLNIGQETLDNLYNKKSLTKTVSMIEANEYKTCSIIHHDQTYFFFETSQNAQSSQSQQQQRPLTRIFWSLAEIEKSHSLVRPLPHFYGELAKTDYGTQYIQNNKAFCDDFKKFLFNVHSAYLSMNDDENEYEVDSNSNLELRSCLWAIGMIGSSNCGLSLLTSFKVTDQHNNAINIIDDICILTQQSPTLSIRGTCLYVLGLLSRTATGMQILSRHGFSFPADNLELDLGVAIPSNINSFFKLGKCPYMQSDFIKNTKISCFSPPNLCRPANMKPMDPNELLGKQGHTEETVLAHISALCNNVTQKSSASALHRLRSKKPSVFTNPLLFRESLKLLNTYQFRLAAKRFVLFTLFDQVILNEDDNSMDLFDENINDSIMSFKQIREWRYKNKQLQIEKKKKKKRRQKMGINIDEDESKEKVKEMNEVKTPSHKPQIAPSELPEPLIQKSDGNQLRLNVNIRKKAPPRPWPPTADSVAKIKKDQNKKMIKRIGANGSISRVQRAISKFDPAYKKRTVTVGYDADLAASPTKTVLGPNPLSAEQSINEDESVDPEFD